MLSVPTPKLGDAGDTVVTDRPGGRQTWHQTRVMREEHRQRGRSWDGGSTGRGVRTITGETDQGGQCCYGEAQFRTVRDETGETEARVIRAETSEEQGLWDP